MKVAHRTRGAVSDPLADCAFLTSSEYSPSASQKWHSVRVEPLLIRCRFCGPFPLDPNESAVAQIHEHSQSESHQEMVLLDFEMKVWMAGK